MNRRESNARACAAAAASPSGVFHVRHRHDTEFTVVGNHLALHPGISAAALGYAVRIQAMPDGASVSIRTLADRFVETEYRIAQALNELEAAGYLVRQRERTPEQRIVTRTTYYEHPDDRLLPTPPEPPSPPPASPPPPADTPEPPQTAEREQAPAAPDAPDAPAPPDAPDAPGAPDAPDAPAVSAAPAVSVAPAVAAVYVLPVAPSDPPEPDEPPPPPSAPAAAPIPAAATTATTATATATAATAAATAAPAAASAPPPPSTFIPTPVTDLLSGLRLTDARLTLSVRDVIRLTPAVSVWLDRGVPPAHIVRTLTSMLPAGTIFRPAAILEYRLTEWLPPPLPLRPAEEPRRVRDTTQECRFCGDPFESQAPPPTSSPPTSSPSSATPSPPAPARCPRCRTAEAWTEAAPRPASLRNLHAPTHLRTGAAASGRTPAARARSAAATAVPR
ncbi:hypothetical protein [Streptomyces sp. CB02923]|uniref:hypothetical protein n=1 Tax=Streptomyces sp. CB02923 TaxID=1718985 RepID=UPI0019002163|nr:hypothetical protein [Streptomyces sp. CB02923]